MTLDERLESAAQELRDRFEAIEAPDAPMSGERSLSSLRSGLLVAAGTFLAVVASAAVFLWLGLFTDGTMDTAGESAATGSVSTSADPAQGVDASPSIESCGSVSEPMEPVSAPELPRTQCALTDLLNAYFAAWDGHDTDTVISYFQPPFSLVIGGPAGGSEVGSYLGHDARALLERWFTDGLGIERSWDGGGTGPFHVEATIHGFGSGEQIHAINILEFTDDPFTSAREEQSPLVTHYIFLLDDETTLTAARVIDHLLNGGTPESLDSLLIATPTGS